MRLVQALDPDVLDVVLDETIHDPNSDVDVPLALIVQIVTRDLLAELTEWDPTAAAYCEFMLDNLEISPVMAEELEDLIE